MIPIYSCTEGVLNGTDCDTTEHSTVPADMTPKYSCTEGVLNGTNCDIQTTVTTSPDYLAGSFNASQGKCTSAIITICN